MSYSDEYYSLSYCGDGIHFAWWKQKPEEPERPDDYFDLDEIDSLKTVEDLENYIANKDLGKVNSEPANNVKINEQVRNRLIELSRTFQTTKALRNALFRNVVDLCLSKTARRYCSIENISMDYAKIAGRSGVLLEVLLNILCKIGVRPIKSDIVYIERIISHVLDNKEGFIVYDRVSLIQKTLHNIISKYLGEGAQYTVNKDVMREALSFSRLHISIVDMKYKDFYSFTNELYNIDLKRKASQDFKPEYVALAGKSYIKNWSSRHLKTLVFYSSPECRDFFRVLVKCDESQKIEFLIDNASQFWPLDELP